MIEVKIASQLTPSGVEGLRWVLVEPADDEAAAAAAAAPVPQRAAAPAPRTPALAHGLKALAVLLGLGGALWVAKVVLGVPPGAAPQPPAAAAHAAPAATPQVAPPTTLPAQAPARPAQAPASVPLPVPGSASPMLNAGWR